MEMDRQKRKGCKGGGSLHAEVGGKKKGQTSQDFIECPTGTIRKGIIGWSGTAAMLMERRSWTEGC